MFVMCVYRCCRLLLYSVLDVVAAYRLFTDGCVVVALPNWLWWDCGLLVCVFNVRCGSCVLLVLFVCLLLLVRFAVLDVSRHCRCWCCVLALLLVVADAVMRGLLIVVCSCVLRIVCCLLLLLFLLLLCVVCCLRCVRVCCARLCVV